MVCLPREKRGHDLLVNQLKLLFSLSYIVLHQTFPTSKPNMNLKLYSFACFICSNTGVSGINIKGAAEWGSDACSNDTPTDTTNAVLIKFVQNPYGGKTGEK